MKDDEVAGFRSKLGGGGGALGIRKVYNEI